MYGQLDPAMGTGWDIAALTDQDPDYEGSCGKVGDEEAGSHQQGCGVHRKEQPQSTERWRDISASREAQEHHPHPTLILQPSATRSSAPQAC
jgi:hypothetical protein